MKEAPNPNDSQGLLILLRLMMLIWTPYYIVMSVYCLCRSFGVLIYVFGVTAILFAIAFFMTYRIKAAVCLNYVIVVTLVSAIFLTRGFGWRCSFHNLVYITFLMLWYDSSRTIRVKAVLSFLMAAGVCLVSFATPFGGTILEPNTIEYALVVYVGILVFIFCLSLVAFFFSHQFVEAEHKLREYNRELRFTANTDPLTKLLNRRGCEQELADVQKMGNIYCVAIGDIDFFKKVNDTYGHDCGDYVLSSLSAEFKQFMQEKGFVARWGGEEFLFVLENINGDQAQEQLDDLRHRIKHKSMHFGENDLSVTMTFGVEECCGNYGYDQAIEKADAKLYIGKQNGRDQVVF
ncbi:MAG: GGDEF domain-containing protein [Lachnospiraceae bacterium]|nr:GGDEF domain-containing protein [Lachnospiraceae bacterium]